MLSGLEFKATLDSDFTLDEHGAIKPSTGTVTLTTDSNDDLVKAYPHTHPFKNVPLKLMKDKDEVRKVGAKQTDHQGRTSAIPVVHEQKTGETGPTGN